ncbi:MAG: LysR substrate-binding domain-containing protein [Rikenellaceae bacterium]
MIEDFRLKVYVTVAHTLSFTKSASILNISQPAVTKHIKELEKSTEKALFFRDGNKISLTAFGKDFLQQVKKIIDSYDSLNNFIDTQTEESAGELNIGASSTIAQYVLPEILANFQRRYPQIKIKMVSGNSEEISEKVKNESVDFALVEGSHTNHSFHYEHFLEDEIVAVTAIDNNLNEVKIDNLYKIPLIVREEGSGTLSVIDKVLLQHGIVRKNLDIRIQLGSSEGIIRYLLNSNCMAFISIAAAYEALKLQKLKIVDIDGITIKRNFRFISLHGKTSRLSRIFINFCKSKNKKNQ